MSDLTLFTTDELVRELMRRWPHLAVVGLKRTSEFTGVDENIHNISYCGDYFVLLGLLAEAQMEIRADFTPENAEDPHPEGWDGRVP